MAYLNFSETLPGAAPGDRQAAEVQPADDQVIGEGFSALEWLVIGLARRDRLSSLEQQGPLARAMRGLVGLGTASRLADERLEQLRRMAVLAWHRGWRLPDSEIGAFLGLFSKGQLETLMASVIRQRVRLTGRAPA